MQISFRQATHKAGHLARQETAGSSVLRPSESDCSGEISEMRDRPTRKDTQLCRDSKFD